MPIVVKGVLHPDDAVRFADHGVNAVVVSNHGGRALDGVSPTPVKPVLRTCWAVCKIRRRPEMIPPVVEEVLRFESPIQRGWRRFTRDVQVHGHRLCAGDLVYVMLGAANRDERHFGAAQEFRPERRPNQHLGFGYGIHFCVGAALARLEASVALDRLSARLPDLHLAGSVAWMPSVHQRTLARLEVEFSRRPEREDRAIPSRMQPRTPP